MVTLQWQWPLSVLLRPPQVQVKALAVATLQPDAALSRVELLNGMEAVVADGSRCQRQWRMHSGVATAVSLSTVLVRFASSQ